VSTAVSNVNFWPGAELAVQLDQRRQGEEARSAVAKRSLQRYFQLVDAGQAELATWLDEAELTKVRNAVKPWSADLERVASTGAWLAMVVHALERSCSVDREGPSYVRLRARLDRLSQSGAMALRGLLELGPPRGS
jgi:hypothetical protein